MAQSKYISDAGLAWYIRNVRTPFLSQPNARSRIRASGKFIPETFKKNNYTGKDFDDDIDNGSIFDEDGYLVNVADDGIPYKAASETIKRWESAAKTEAARSGRISGAGRKG